jgi:hypothetical protein
MRNLKIIGRRAAAFGAAAALLAGISTPVQAQQYFTNPDFRPAPIEGSDPLVGLPIPGATPAEYRAHLLWNLRSGLNVAALQCQFSPFLRAVPNYNAFLAHHSGELATAYTNLNGYFKRVHGAKGQKAFDDYSTMTYNNFASLQAQLGFCQAAASILKSSLAAPKGSLQTFAQQNMRTLRNSLIVANDPTFAVYRPVAVPYTMPPLTDDCWTKKNVLRPRCGGVKD